MGTKIYECHLTDNYQLKEADKLISKLKQQIGGQDCYILELEYLNTRLEADLNKYKQKYQVLAAKYNTDMQTLNKELRETELIRSIEAERDKWKNLYKSMRDARDSAINELAKLHNNG